MKIFIKIFKIFFAFICAIVVLGLIMVTIKNYMAVEVEITSVKTNFFVKNNTELEGIVDIKTKDVVEIKASMDMVISEVYVSQGQILGNQENAMQLFKLDVDSPILSNNEVIENYDNQISDINSEIKDIFDEISKKLGRDVTSINSIDPDSGITIYAPSDGKISNLQLSDNKKLNGNNKIATLIDDESLIIRFEMTPSEFANMSAGQLVLLTYTGYEGYYPGRIESINTNAIPTQDKKSYIYNGIIKAPNPGLVSPGLTVGINIEQNGEPKMLLLNDGIVDSYGQNVDIIADSPLAFGSDIYASEVYVKEGDFVTKGQQIAVINGESLTESLNLYIINIDNKYKQLAKVQKNRMSLFNDIIYSNVEHNINITNTGRCITSDKMYIEYVTEKTTLSKGETILRYRLCDRDNLVIKVSTKYDQYPKEVFYDSGLTCKTSAGSIKVLYIGQTYFDNYIETTYTLPKEADVELKYNDKLKLELVLGSYYDNVVPKTSIVYGGKLNEEQMCYVYVLTSEDTMLGTIDVISKKSAYITKLINENVMIRFKDEVNTDKPVQIVKYANSTLKDGMRVRVKK